MRPIRPTLGPAHWAHMRQTVVSFGNLRRVLCPVSRSPEVSRSPGRSFLAVCPPVQTRSMVLPALQFSHPSLQPSNLEFEVPIPASSASSSKNALRGAVRSALRGAVRNALRGAVRNALRGAVRNALRGAVRNALRGAVRNALRVPFAAEGWGLSVVTAVTLNAWPVSRAPCGDSAVPCGDICTGYVFIGGTPFHVIM